MKLLRLPCPKVTLDIVIPAIKPRRSVGDSTMPKLLEFGQVS